MMEPVRYRPGEAIRWLEMGAGSSRKSAQNKGKDLVQRRGGKPLMENVATAAGALFDMGKSAYADVLHNAAREAEIVLFDDHFEAGKGVRKPYRYADVRRIEIEGDQYTIVLQNDRVTIKPYAHLVSGRVRVPIGWSRNGIEVPYELVIEEIAARAGIEAE
jgi:hypothetical protein